MAVMARVPAVLNEVVTLACPLLFSVAVPSVLLPALKVTDPVAKPPYWPVTVAVNVID
jgi:hypothetical protein